MISRTIIFLTSNVVPLEGSENTCPEVLTLCQSRRALRLFVGEKNREMLRHTTGEVLLVSRNLSRDASSRDYSINLRLYRGDTVRKTKIALTKFWDAVYGLWCNKNRKSLNETIAKGVVTFRDFYDEQFSSRNLVPLSYER